MKQKYYKMFNQSTNASQKQIKDACQKKPSHFKSTAMKARTPGPPHHLKYSQAGMRDEHLPTFIWNSQCPQTVFFQVIKNGEKNYHPFPSTISLHISSLVLPTWFFLHTFFKFQFSDCLPIHQIIKTNYKNKQHMMVILDMRKITFPYSSKNPPMWNL